MALNETPLHFPMSAIQCRHDHTEDILDGPDAFSLNNNRRLCRGHEREAMLLNTHNHPAFAAYALCSLVLIANLFFLWAYSGAVRGKTRTAINPEDSERFKAKLVDSDPPEVARVLRAHANAQAIVYPFLFLGLLYVLMGGSAGVGAAMFGIFTVFRLLHSVFYLAALQPWRTLSFVVSGLTAAALLLDVAWMMIQGGAA